MAASVQRPATSVTSRNSCPAGTLSAFSQDAPNLYTLFDTSGQVQYKPNRLAFIVEARLAGVARSKMLPKIAKLNKREIEVLTWVSRGKKSLEIARKLRLSKRTVDFHIDNARIKLRAATRTEAAIKAAASGLIEP